MPETARVRVWVIRCMEGTRITSDATQKVCGKQPGLRLGLGFRRGVKNQELKIDAFFLFRSGRVLGFVLPHVPENTMAP